jgi:hypothetical protein
VNFFRFFGHCRFLTFLVTFVTPGGQTAGDGELVTLRKMISMNLEIFVNFFRFFGHC